MRQDKNLIFKLREQGKTYSEIKKIFNISQSTLSNWFTNQKWSKDIKKSNTIKNIKNGTDHLLKMNEKRRIINNERYEETEKEAIKEFEIYKNNPLFMAGLMLYAGEGDKTNKYNIKLTNSEFYLHVIFIAFLEKFLNIKRDKIKIWLLLYPDHDIEKSIKIWSEKLIINKSNFHKSQVIIGKEKTKKLQYGVGNSIISSVILKKKLLKWLELCKDNFK